MNNAQPTLPGLLLNGEPVEVSGADLAAVLAQAKHAGLYVRRMDANGSSYTLHLLRDPNPDCECDLCQSIGEPSDKIEAALRLTAELEGTPTAPPVPASASHERRISPSASPASQCATRPAPVDRAR